MEKDKEFWDFMDELKKHNDNEVEINAEKVGSIPKAKKELKKYLDVYNEFDKQLTNLTVVFYRAFDHR